MDCLPLPLGCQISSPAPSLLLRPRRFSVAAVATLQAAAAPRPSASLRQTRQAGRPPQQVAAAPGSRRASTAPRRHSLNLPNRRRPSAAVSAFAEVRHLRLRLHLRPRLRQAGLPPSPRRLAAIVVWFEPPPRVLAPRPRASPLSNRGYPLPRPGREELQSRRLRRTRPSHLAEPPQWISLAEWPPSSKRRAFPVLPLR